MGLVLTVIKGYLLAAFIYNLEMRINYSSSFKILGVR
jgi:hypothetical protein